MSQLVPTSLFRGRSISWKVIFVVFTMTAAAWGSSFWQQPISSASVFADEIQQPDAETAEADSSTGHASDAEHAEGGHAGGHTDPVAEVLLAILIILFLAKVVGDLFERMSMPAVLGELTVGIVLGNWALFTGSDIFDFFKPHPGDADNLTGTVLDMLARIGVVLLLFEVGLESRIKEMVS
ncbi:MAG: cation:proton antiporter, partial [Fuerstiella sp.]